MTKAFLFDIDGTLVDSVDLHSAASTRRASNRFRECATGSSGFTRTARRVALASLSKADERLLKVEGLVDTEPPPTMPPGPSRILIYCRRYWKNSA